MLTDQTYNMRTGSMESMLKDYYVILFNVCEGVFSFVSFPSHSTSNTSVFTRASWILTGLHSLLSLVWLITNWSLKKMNVCVSQPTPLTLPVFSYSRRSHGSISTVLTTYRHIDHGVCWCWRCPLASLHHNEFHNKLPMWNATKHMALSRL